MLLCFQSKIRILTEANSHILGFDFLHYLKSFSISASLQRLLAWQAVTFHSVISITPPVSLLTSCCTMSHQLVASYQISFPYQTQISFSFPHFSRLYHNLSPVHLLYTCTLFYSNQGVCTESLQSDLIMSLSLNLSSCAPST